MNVVVSNNAINYKGFLKVNKLADVEKITGKIDCLVYHKSNEPSEEKVAYLTKYKEIVGKLVYIRNKEDYDKAIKMIVVGSGGKYFDDEFFLESTEELTNLISNIDEVTAIAELGGINVVSDFLNRYLKDGSSNFNREYLKVVKQAVTGMMSEYRKKDIELLQMSETATELFAHTASIISKVEEEKDKLKESIKVLEKAKDSFSSNTIMPVATPSIMFFPTVSYLKDKNIFRVKKIGGFDRLVSFILGYKLYLENIKYLKVKTIFVVPVGKMYEGLYKDFSWVTQSNYKTMSGYYDSVVFTNYPTKEVLTRLLDDNNYDTFVMIDMLTASEKHILNCKGNVRYAVSSKRLAEEYKIKPVSSFYANGDNVGLFTVKYDENYPTEREQRERYYLRVYTCAYDTLYSLRKG